MKCRLRKKQPLNRKATSQCKPKDGEHTASKVALFYAERSSVKGLKALNHYTPSLKITPPFLKQRPPTLNVITLLLKDNMLMSFNFAKFLLYFLSCQYVQRLKMFSWQSGRFFFVFYITMLEYLHNSCSYQRVSSYVPKFFLPQNPFQINV